MAGAQNKYVPGVCNIGPVEIAQRRRIATTSAAISIILAVVLIFLPLPHIVRVVVFLPLFAAFSAAIQVRSHFCAGFGMTGLFNFTDELGKTETAQQSEWRAKDKRRAITIMVQAVVLAVIVTAIVVII